MSVYKRQDARVNLAEQEAYWQQKLGGDLPRLEVPLDYPRPPVQLFIKEREAIECEKKLCLELKQFCQSENVALFITLIAALKIILIRYTAQEDIIVGSLCGDSLRPTKGESLEKFTNPIVLRTSLSANQSAKQLLRGVAGTIQEAAENRDYPFDNLVEKINGNEDLTRAPIFQVMLVPCNVPFGISEIPISEKELTDISEYSARCDLVFIVSEPEGVLRIDCAYDAELFESASIKRMLGHFQTLLKGIVVNPEQCIWTLPLLNAAERHQLLVEWNDTQTDYPKEQCIHQLFEKQVEQTPDAVAVVYEDKQLTYRELNDRANQLAHYLRQCGVEQEVLVGLYLERSLNRVVGLLAILKAGGVYLPLDPAYPQERVNFILKDSQASVVITQNSLILNLQKDKAKIIDLEQNSQEIKTQVKCNPKKIIAPNNLAYIIYTSGSTGTPKGVSIEHRAIFCHCQTIVEHYELTQFDRVLQFASAGFDASLEQILPTLIVGATLILSETKFLTGLDFNRKLKELGLTVVNLPPAYWNQWLQSIEDNPSAIFLARLRLVICGGETMSPESLKLWQKSPMRSVRLLNAYGPTETTITAMTFELPQGSSLSKILIGRPLKNRKVYILDPCLQPVPIGTPGELYIGGDGLARGYLNRPELTKEKFIPNPFSNEPTSRLYKTGDLARYLPDSNIEFLGRLDNQVKIRGFRIELGEIEFLLSQHPQVREAAVITCEDQPGNKRLVAYLVTNQKAVSLGELRHFLKQKLPDYMIPGAFVFLDTLPLTPNGKIDRRALPVPDLPQKSREDRFIAPRTPTEEILGAIWAKVLGVQQIGIYDNFFELGGHSLLATQVISRIREAFSVELPLPQLFASPTLTGLAESIELVRQTSPSLQLPAVEPISRDTQVPLSFAQERLWFLDQLEGGSATYNIPTAIKLSGLLNVAALESALQEILRRHEVLRTSFKTVDGSPIQVIDPNATLILPLIDLQTLAETEQAAEVQRLARIDAQTPFDLSQSPLVRATLLQLGENSHALLLNMHHIVSDGWSMGIFIHELSTLYQAFCRGESSPLSDLPIQYADFAYWQRQYLSGEVLEGQLDYWKEQLAGISPLLELPTDRPRPPVQTFRGSTLSMVLNAELTKKLKALNQQSGTTLFMTLLAAFAVLLSRYSGQKDIVVGSPIANRNRAEIESLIGFFVNTLVLRTKLQDNPCFEEVLKQVRQVALDAYSNQDLPFEQLVEVLQPERNLSHSPLFQVMFVLQNAPMGKLELPGLSLTPMEVESAIAKFDLTVLMEETEQELKGLWEYNSDLFDATTIERMSWHFQTLLEGIVANPQERVGQLQMLTEAERQQLLVEWNDTRIDYPKDKCIHQLFEEQVERTPDTIAAAFEDEQLTYRELNQRANQLANYLQVLGVGSEMLVGICMERSLEMIVGLVGILKAGGAYVPLDPDYPTERLALMLEDTQVSVLLTQQSLVEKLPANKAHVLCLDTEETLSRQNEDNTTSNTRADNLAYIIYTSGSTGKPKGVAVSHQAVTRLLFNTNYIKLEPDDKIAQVSNISFDAATFEIWGALLHGGKLVVITKNVLLSSQSFAAQLREQGISVLFLTTALFNQLANAVPQAFKKLRYLLFGGEAVEPKWVNEILKKAPPQRLLHVYGPTENTTFSSWYWVRDVPEGATTLPIGRSISNTQLYILDRYLQPVPLGVSGELYIGGDGLARGYLNRPELTEEKFILNPFSDEPTSRLYKTGDLARYLPDGNIEFLGRLDNQVKIRGFRIELGEIEMVLSQHFGVLQTIVIFREDQHNDKYLVAYIVPNQKQLPSVTKLRGFLKQKLPDYMIPTAFVMLDALPLTPNGKVNRSDLPAPDQTRQESKETFVAPRTLIEKQLAAIWAEVLSLEQVGIYDNFFHLGGHSLKVTQVVSRVQETFRVELPLRTLFEASTIASLSKVISGYRSMEPRSPKIERISREKHRIKASSRETLEVSEEIKNKILKKKDRG
jgi:amino acid adenylation domain-containing protein